MTLDQVRDDVALLHRKVDHLLLAVHAILLTKEAPMATKAEVLDALTKNDNALLVVGAKAATLIAAHGDAGAEFDEVLARVGAQGNAIMALDAKIGGALPPVDEPVTTEPAQSDAAPADAPATDSATVAAVVAYAPTA